MVSAGQESNAVASGSFDGGVRGAGLVGGRSISGDRNARSDGRGQSEAENLTEDKFNNGIMTV